MSDAWRVASIETFEQVPVASSSGLLRVSAQSPFRSRPDDLRPSLVADDGSSVSRFAAIPAPPDTGGMLRAAFSVPADVATPETVFSLEFGDGFVIALPDPTVGASRLNRPVRPAPASPPDVAPPALTASEPVAAAADPSAAPEAPEAPGGEERRSELHSKMTELAEGLAESRRQLVDLRDAADFGTRARDMILGMLSAAAVASAELQATRDLHLHTASGTAPADADGLSELQRRLGDTERQLDETTQRAESAVRELADHRDQAQVLEDRVAAAESEARGHLDRLGDAERERDQAHEARRQAEGSAEPLLAARTRAEAELAESQDQVHKMAMERDELSRQAQAFDGVAIKARERLTEAEAELRSSSGRLGELEVWTAELERRLAEATTQLADARSAAQADEAELRMLRERVGSPTADHTISDYQLDEIRNAAFAEAHVQAERDLGDASPSRRS